MALRRIIATLSVLLIVTCAGIVTGLFLHHLDNKNTTVSVTEQSHDAPPEQAIPPNGTIYIVSPPHRGYAHRSILFEVSAQAAGHLTAHADIDETQARAIQKDQPAYLYNQEAQLLALPAKVTGKRLSGKDSDTAPEIDISMAALPDLPPEQIVVAEIITHSFTNANRLPIEALQTDKDGKPFLWEATRQQDGRIVALRRNLPFTAVADKDVLIFENPDYVSNNYILNPDADLKDGQNILVVEKTYSAPEFLKPARLVHAYMAKLKQYEQMKSEPDPTQTSGFSASCGTSCGGISPSNDFIQRIKSLAEKQSMQQVE